MIGFQLGRGDRIGFAHADDLVGRQGPRAQTQFLTPAVDDRFEPTARTAADVQRADALGPINLVRGKRHQVHLQLGQVDGQLAHALRRIDMEQDGAFAAQLADGRDIGNRPDLVIHLHQRDQDGVVTQRVGQLLRFDHATRQRAQVGELEAFLFQLPAGIQNRLVLDFRGDDVPAPIAAKACAARDRQVIRFGGA